jgi:hypothetical protein
MEPIQAKFAAFMGALSPEEQRAVIPLMKTFTDTMGAPMIGCPARPAGAEETSNKRNTAKAPRP